MISSRQVGSAIRELVRRGGLHEFCRQFWHVNEGAPFQDNWHIGALCDHLTAVSAGDIKRLIVNQPPGTMKSVSCNIMWPSWHWLVKDPTSKWIFASNDRDLVRRDAQRSIKIWQSNECRWAYPKFRLGSGATSVERFTNEHGGMRFGATPGGGAVGWHCNFQVIDDPIKPQAIRAATTASIQSSLKSAETWIRETLGTRLLPGKQSGWVVMMQRLHDCDPAGVFLEEEGVDHLMLPMKFEPKATWDRGSSLGQYDPRTERGELLWPSYVDDKEAEARAKRLKTPEAIEAQEQQNPQPAAGGIINDRLIHYYDEVPNLRFARVISSWDLAFKGTQIEHSRVAAQKWAMLPDRRAYLLDMRVGWLDYAESKKLVKESRTFWKEVSLILGDGSQMERNEVRMKHEYIDLLQPLPFYRLRAPTGISPERLKTAFSMTNQPKQRARDFWLAIQEQNELGKALEEFLGHTPSSINTLGQYLAKRLPRAGFQRVDRHGLAWWELA